MEAVLLLSQITNMQMNFINRLLENLRDGNFIRYLETIFGGVDLVDTQSLSKYNKEIKYLLCAIDLFSKFALVVPLKDKIGISIVNAFQKIISKGGEAEYKGRRKPNKIWLIKVVNFTIMFLRCFGK